MKVHVKFLATIREIIGVPEIELELRPGDTVRVALQALQARYGTEFKEATTGTTAGEIPKVRFLVNGRNTDFLEELETELKDGDIMVLVPPVAGG
ncbi:MULTISPECIES: MoaD/ThiS family protein [unclassified Methanosarcina]|uniref:MoaD/ThiS family protein n=1 Tax=unclassified Methanosarcina TaxID=2644672 RepID=UPI00061548A0|nr:MULTISPECIES: MoaD/ThiS family protein [unclassified Methanosarcina]AKB19959.1 Ubiquitin-like small archaeal modifier protein SAMP1 [Methanosarcina sp. WWM596]AKB22245.1 Ubiquitin-like small archaeal modifier protein SAMP1 [Methanosarcina sp. WH1]